MLSATAQRPSASNAATSNAAEYLTFRLGQESNGIDILRVQEIRSYEQPTRLAHAPDFIKGVIDLRGVIVPIVDLRLAALRAGRIHRDFTVVIILSVGGTVLRGGGGRRGRRGRPAAEAIRPAPQFQGQVDGSFRARHRHRGRAHAHRAGH